MFSFFFSYPYCNVFTQVVDPTRLLGQAVHLDKAIEMVGKSFMINLSKYHSLGVSAACTAYVRLLFARVRDRGVVMTGGAGALSRLPFAAAFCARHRSEDFSFFRPARFSPPVTRHLSTRSRFSSRPRIDGNAIRSTGARLFKRRRSRPARRRRSRASAARAHSRVDAPCAAHTLATARRAVLHNPHAASVDIRFRTLDGHKTVHNAICGFIRDVRFSFIPAPKVSVK